MKRTITMLLCATSLLYGQKITESNFWKNLQAGKTQKLVISGTSTSQAHSSDMHGQSRSAFVDWPLKLKNELESQFGSGSIKMYMATCAGVTSKVLMGMDPVKAHIGTKFIDYTVGIAADAVLMEWAVGADCADKFNLPSSESKQYHIDAIDALRANQNTEIFLWTGARSTGSSWNDRKGGEGQPAYAEMIRQLAKEKNCYLVETYSDFQALFDQLGESSYTKEYIPDGNHTSTKAAQEVIVPKLIQAFKGFGPPPTFTIKSPTANTVVNIGQELTVTWNFNPDSLNSMTELLISVDLGKSFLPIPDANGLDPSAPDYGTFTFVVPEMVGGVSAETDQAIIKVQEYDSPKHALSPFFQIRSASYLEVFDTLDNTDSRVSLIGDWSTSSASDGYYGSGYVHDANTGKGAKTAAFVPGLQAAGTYEVFVSYTSDKNRASNVPVTVSHISGDQTITLNQQTGKGFVSVGTFSFSQGDQAKVTISNAGTNGIVVVDAVAFVLVSSTATITHRPRSIGSPAQPRSGNRLIAAQKGSRLTVPTGARHVQLFDCAGRMIASQAITTQTRSIAIPRAGIVYARFLNR